MMENGKYFAVNLGSLVGEDKSIELGMLSQENLNIWLNENRNMLRELINKKINREVVFDELKLSEDTFKIAYQGILN